MGRQDGNLPPWPLVRLHRLGGRPMSKIRDGQAALDRLMVKDSILPSEQDTPREVTRNGNDPGAYDDVLAVGVRYADKSETPVNGDRNRAAFSLAGQLFALTHKQTGETLTEDDVLGLVQRWNARNPDPLPEREIDSTVRSAATNGTPRPPKLVGHDLRGGKRSGASSPVTKIQTHQPPQPTRKAFIMRHGGDIDDAGTAYLWKRRIPLGALTVVFSRPGRGKSTLAADMTARVTNGKAWADGSPCPQGTTIYIKGEGTDASIRDRHKLSGADGSKYVVIGKTDDDDSPMIDLAEDGPLLNDALDQLPDTKLVIIDTLDSLFPSMRMIDNANIRRCLWPLQEIAEARNLAVVVFAHTNKGGYADPLDRLSGGRAIGGAARAIWYLGKMDPEADEHYMAPVKCNDFAPAKTLEYSIVSTSPDTPGVIRWGDECDTSAWELDGARQADHGNKAEDCERWLGEFLADGPKPTGEVTKAAGDLEFGIRVLKKAKVAHDTYTKPAK
ncbi:MAG: AAA family ATPase, partial [Phycisphaeraceae bacterium]